MGVSAGVPPHLSAMVPHQKPGAGSATQLHIVKNAALGGTTHHDPHGHVPPVAAGHAPYGTHAVTASVPPATYHLPGTTDHAGTHVEKASGQSAPVPYHENKEQGLVLHRTESAAAKEVRPSMVTFVDQR